MMSLFGVSVLALLAAFSIYGAYASHSQLTCLSCHSVLDPNDCVQTDHCSHKEYCAVDVYEISHGSFRFHLSCKDKDSCPAEDDSRRKRDSTHRCSKCCLDRDNCNADLCQTYKPTIVQPMRCLSCPSVRDPRDCNHYETCQQNEICSSGVVHLLGISSFKLSCRPINECHESGFVIKFLGLLEECDQCCHGDGCNRKLCNQYVNNSLSTITVPPTLTTANQHTTPAVYDLNCRDHEEDGIACASLDLFNVCADQSYIGIYTAHKKCPKHCGICHSAVQSHVHVTPPPDGVCADYELDGLMCSTLNQFSLCSDTSTLAFVLSHKKCSKYCGFCKTNNGVAVQLNTTYSSSSSKTHPTTTPATKSTTQPITISTTQTPIATAPLTTLKATALAQTTTDPSLFPCIDLEDSTFSCKEWASHGYCNHIPGTGYEIAKLRCQKFCGFCQ